MDDGSGAFPEDGGAEVDQEQAAELAASLVDPDLRERCRDLSRELDELHRRVEAIRPRVRRSLEELMHQDEEGTRHRGHAILHGVDTSMTFATLVRAQELLSSWSGEDGLTARVHRLAILVADLIGLEFADIINVERMERDLLEERGR